MANMLCDPDKEPLEFHPLSGAFWGDETPKEDDFVLRSAEELYPDGNLLAALCRT